MALRGWGRVINIASVAGKSAMPYIAAYAASKHGLLGLTKVAALEMAQNGVTVNAICPGYVDTPMTSDGIARIAGKTGLPPGDVRKKLEEMSPQKRMVSAEEVAALALFLCGEEARGITGQGLNVDGGTVM
jgi:NAD(P)-dependent dehydrogenase (short-subunit alcohol dehydrogenase family)